MILIHWLAIHIVLVACLVLGGLLFYALIVFVGAWIETKTAPRIDMLDCPAHGLVPKSLCITFKETETLGALQEVFCPFCYEDAYKKAEQKLKTKERIRV